MSQQSTQDQARAKTLKLTNYSIPFAFLMIATIFALSAGKAGASSLQQELLGMVEQGADSAAELALPGDDIDSYLSHADKLLEQQQFKKALNYYTKVIMMDRDKDEAFLGRSLAYGGSGRLEESIADLNAFILRNPKHSMAHVYRGVRYMSMGETHYAEKNLLKAINLNPKNAQAYDDLGVLYAQQGAVEKALKYFGQSLRIDPYNETAYHNLAIAYFLLEQNEKALKAVDRAIRLTPESRDTYILKAQILDALGRADEARKVRHYAKFLAEEFWTESVSVN